MNQEKEFVYAYKLLSKVQELFDNEDGDGITIEELTQGNNTTAFIHALSNIMPNMVFQKLTGEETNNLEFNHIANRLCFQFSSLHKSNSDVEE